ncbi:MAG: HIT family protein [Phycisphaerae bacterium]|nr:HIT family protein [Phycisphaerae bacterium]
MACIFCRIVAGEVPSLKVYEDDSALAFLDIGPLAEGHVLVIPKRHYERLEEMPAEEVGAVTRHLPVLAKAVLKATGAGAYNVLQNNGEVAGQAVGHVHFHIIPRTSGDGLGYRWNATSYAAGRDRQLQEAIVSALG